MPGLESDSDSEEGNTAWWARFDRGYSVCMFSPENALRVRITRIVDTSLFGNLVLTLIVVNTCTMAMNCEDYFPVGGAGAQFFDIFDYGVT